MYALQKLLWQPLGKFASANIASEIELNFARMFGVNFVHCYNSFRGETTALSRVQERAVIVNLIQSTFRASALRLRPKTATET